MDNKPIKKVVIVGGGTAGWISAAALVKLLGPTIDITLIESDSIGTIGVGEATIPQIRRLNGVLGLDENDFIRKTKGTFKLGIEFANWGEIGERYLHTFGDVGINLGGVHFHQYWLRAVQSGHIKGDTAALGETLWDYSLHNTAAYAHKFARMEKVGSTPMNGLHYAFHFDAGLYANVLRDFAEAQGVTRIEGKVVDVNMRDTDGFIESVTLESGECVDGELFIDCSGFRALLMGGALDVPYHDWSHYLPCNSAVTAPCKSVEPLLPYTKATAHSAGWSWRIPLQHRIGNGHVYCDKFISDDDATQILLDDLDAEPLSEPRVIKFTTGRREKLWHKNCVAIGLSGGFMEPLESTSIHFIQSNISKLVELFPTTTFDPADAREYNRQVMQEFDLVRDFLVLHYKLTRRDDTPFWRHCRDMDIPDSLRDKMELFQSGGRIYREPYDLFRDSSWVQVMVGQGLMPRAHHPMADKISDENLTEFLSNVQAICEKATDTLPSHAEFVASVTR